MHDRDDYVTAPSGISPVDREQDLARDQDLPQPERNSIPWIIGILTLVGVIIVVGVIIATTVASVLIVIPIAAAVLFLGWVPWLIERGNRHPH